MEILLNRSGNRGFAMPIGNFPLKSRHLTILNMYNNTQQYNILAIAISRRIKAYVIIQGLWQRYSRISDDYDLPREVRAAHVENSRT